MSIQQEHFDIERLAEKISSRMADLPSRTVPSVRAVRREFSKTISQSSADQVIELALRLLENVATEQRFVPYELVNSHKAAMRSLNLSTLQSLGKGLDSWYSVDSFAPYLAGPAWREGQITDEDVHRWTRSEDRWWRRTALVCTVALNNKARGGTGDTDRTLRVCRLLVEDRDDMVLKAMSWALRELVKHDAKAVQAFLDEHDQSLAKRVIREVRNKLDTGLKTPRR